MRSEVEARNRQLEQLMIERERAEEELRAAREQLAQRQRLESLGLLAGGVAHDFNNLLVAILGFAELGATRGGDSAKLRRYLAEIEGAARRAAELCDQMLSFTGARPIRAEPTDVNALVRQLGSLIAAVPDRVPIRYELEDSLPLIAVDEAQLQQVLLNLLTNAFEASEGRGEVVVRTRVSKREASEIRRVSGIDDLPTGLYLVVEVADRGSGIDETSRARIFEPFYSTKPDGRGLGLSTSLGIVRSHDGLIEVASRPEGGTRFSVSLPFVRGAAPTNRQRSLRPSSRGRVLVVDDEPSVREYLSTALHEWGYESRCAADTESAFSELREAKAPFDVAIVDVTMPGRPGTEFARALIEMKVEMPVILVSGFSSRQLGDELRQLRHRGVTFLQKPFSLPELERTLAEQLDPAVVPLPVVPPKAPRAER